MATTGNALITQVANELNRSDLDVGGTNVAVTQRELNAAFRDLFNRYPFSWRVSDPPMAVPTVAGTTLYDTSAAAYDPAGLGINVQDIYMMVLDTGDLQTRPLDEQPFWRFERKWANLAYQAQNKPVEFARRDQYKVLVAPPPDSSSYILRVFYSLEFADITDFTKNLTQIPQRALECIRVMTLARLKRWEYTTVSDDGMATLAAAYQLAEKLIKDLIAEDKMNPNVSFTMQGANFGGPTLTMNYWASPFVRGL